MEKPGRDERRAILRAAEALIGEKGLSRLSPAEISLRARVAPEVFRANFPDMDTLLRALSLAFVEQMIAAAEQSTQPGIWKGAAARDVVEVAVRSIVDVVTERAPLVREILAASAHEKAFAEDLQRVGTMLSKRLVAVMAECKNVPLRPTRSIAFSMLLAVSLAHHYVLVGDSWSGVAFSKEQLTEEAARAVCVYLGLEPTITIRDDGPDAAPTEMVLVPTPAEIDAARRGDA